MPELFRKPTYGANMLQSVHPLSLLALSSCRAACHVQDMADARFTLLGSAKPVAEGEVAAARELFLSRHAGSFWVDFGDFTWFRLEDVVQGRLVGGFARARTVRATQHHRYCERKSVILCGVLQPSCSGCATDDTDCISPLSFVPLAPAIDLYVDVKPVRLADFGRRIRCSVARPGGAVQPAHSVAHERGPC